MNISICYWIENKLLKVMIKYLEHERWYKHESEKKACENNNQFKNSRQLPVPFWDIFNSENTVY